MEAVKESPLSRVFDFDWPFGAEHGETIFGRGGNYGLPNGLDQNMMQKNLTCRSLRDCKTNMFTFSFLFLVTNVLFLMLGALLYLYAEREGIVLPGKSDDVFPFLSLIISGQRPVCFSCWE